MVFAAFAALAALTFCPPAAPAHRAPAERSRPHRPAASAQRLLPAVQTDLYSARAKRRFATYLRFRLLELRREGLEQAAAVVEGRLPLQKLLPQPGGSAGPK